ncbi:unnamed protein product [Acanthoscelides obtectus]|uniref:Globin domain-containing protein n=1 Tax=Acanthoscelides obtectus TaxID=200917 RepID=A0A9P0KHW5_ACAOB|nr:unnamed protein product [Acanthoscelides obtectus]CAK1681645.1 hypothetical protein AOBTE_LOCUS33188 [Acanthoscelides obtectus]
MTASETLIGLCMRYLQSYHNTLSMKIKINTGWFKCSFNVRFLFSDKVSVRVQCVYVGESTMGVLWSMLGYKCAELRDDDPDPVTTLTSKDKFIIRSSWARIMKNPIENGIAILTLFFEDYPQHKQLFPFRDVPNKELGQNKRFQAHCSAIMYSLTSVVDVVDKPDLLVTILMKIGRDHVPRGVNEQGHLVSAQHPNLLNSKHS